MSPPGQPVAMQKLPVLRQNCLMCAVKRYRASISIHEITAADAISRDVSDTRQERDDDITPASDYAF